MKDISIHGIIHLQPAKFGKAYQRGTPAHIYTDKEIVALLSGGRPSRNRRRRTDAATPSARYAASVPIQLSSSSPSGKRLPSGRFVGYSSIYVMTCSCGLWPVSHSRSAPHLHQPASAAPAEGRCGYRRYRGRLCRPFQVSGTYLPKLQSVQVRDQFTGVASMKLSWNLHRI